MKPIMQIDPHGPQGNIFYILGLATGHLLEYPEENRQAIDEMRTRVLNSHSYEEAIDIIQEYVTIKWKGGVPM